MKKDTKAESFVGGMCLFFAGAALVLLIDVLEKLA